MIFVLGFIAIIAAYVVGVNYGKGRPAISDAEADTLRQLSWETEEETRIVCRRFDELRRVASLADGLISSGQADKAQQQLRIAIIASRTKTNERD